MHFVEFLFQSLRLPSRVQHFFVNCINLPLERMLVQLSQTCLLVLSSLESLCKFRVKSLQIVSQPLVFCSEFLEHVATIICFLQMMIPLVAAGCGPDFLHLLVAEPSSAFRLPRWRCWDQSNITQLWNRARTVCWPQLREHCVAYLSRSLSIRRPEVCSHLNFNRKIKKLQI